MQIVTLTTDFGTQDWFVGTMKGVILGINPSACIVDLTHEVRPGDICRGAFALAAGCGFFPKGTIHVAVVDPGVGSERKAIAVQTASYFFVGPDNGVLSFALRNEKIKAIRRIENGEFLLRNVSQTFHGRDVFAPVAAHLSRRTPIYRLGREQESLLRLRWPEPKQSTGSSIAGEIVYIDRFGNAITNIENTRLPGAGTPAVYTGRKRLCAVKPFYAAVRPGNAVAVPGSTGFMEVAVNGSSAAKMLHLHTGKKICVRPQ